MTKNGPTKRQGHSNVTIMQLGEETNSFQDQAEFNIEDIEKLKICLRTLEKSTNLGTCSLAFLGNISQSFTLSVLNMPPTRSWITDSRVIDHMTKSSHDFVSYCLCPCNKKMSMIDDTLITIASLGDVINSKIVLKNVLYVPKLFINLVSIYKLTNDLNCTMTFSSTHCEFQD